MSHLAMQDAIKDLLENEDYRNTLFLNPKKILNDYNLTGDEWMAMNSKSIVSPRVAMTPETGMPCCDICSCAPPLRKN